MSEDTPINKVSAEENEELIVLDLEDVEKKESCVKYLKRDLFRLGFCLFLYFVSLEGCHDSISICLKNISKFTVARICFSLVSSALLLYLNCVKFAKSKQYLLLVIQLVSIGWLFRVDNGTTLDRHGEYNKLFCLGFFCSALIFHCLYVILSIAYRLNKKFFLLICLLFLAAYLKLAYTLKFKTCKDYNKGLFGKFAKSDPKCDFMVPSTCWMDFMDNIMDIPRLTSQKCTYSGNEEAVWKSYGGKKLESAKRICIPDTKNYDPFKEGLMENLQTSFFADIYDLDKKPGHCEVSLTFEKDKTSINYDILRNEEVVKERKEKLKSERKVKNVLHLYLDALSRRHFHRKMPQTAAFFESKGENRAFEFFKHQALDFFTEINTRPMFYGDSMYSKKGVSAFKHLKENGYVTSSASEQCAFALFDVEPGFIEDLVFEAPDHENKIHNCDPNYHNPDSPYSPFLGPYSIYKRCLHGKQVHEHALDYSEKIFDTYPEENKFVRVVSIMAHEPTAELSKYYDRDLAAFLRRLDAKGIFKDTLILLNSDHGNNMAGPYFVVGAEDHFVEKTIASMFLVLPEEHNFSLAELANVKANQHKYTHHYDIYNTFLFLTGTTDKEKYGKGKLAFFDKMPSRDCSDLGEELMPHWCRCRRHHKSLN